MSHRPGFYEIHIEETLETHWQDWFFGMEIYKDAGGTVLYGMIADPTALIGLLNRICELNLTLVSLQRTEAGPDMG
jgi:hypothetical protein